MWNVCLRSFLLTSLYFPKVLFLFLLEMVPQLLSTYHDVTTWMFITLWSDVESGLSYDLIGDIGLLVGDCRIIVLVPEVEEGRRNLVTRRLSMWLRWNSALTQRFCFQGFLPRGSRNRPAGLGRM